MSTIEREAGALARENEALRDQIAALEADSQRFRATLYSIGDAVISADAAGNVLQMNRVAEALTGWSEVEAKGRPTARVFRIVAEETRSAVESPVARVLREGVVVGLANHSLLIAKDGTERPIADSGAPIRDDNGEVTGVVLVFRDQTEERAAQRALSESEAKYRNLVENASVGIFRTKIDGSAVLDANAKLCEMLGLTRDEFVGHPSAIAWANPERRADLVVLLRQKGIINNYEIDIRTKSGEIRTVLLTMTTYPEQDYLEGVLQDITERKQAEDALRITNQVFEDSIASQSIADKGGVITHVNPAFLRLWGYAAKEQAIGNSVGSFFANPADATPVLEALAAHDAWNGEFLARRTDGSTFISRGYATSLRNAAGELIGYQSTNLDVTRERESDAALRESEERNRATLQSIGDGVISTDASGRLTQINPVAQTLTGWTQAEALGQPLARVFRIVNEETRAEVESPVDRVLREGVVVGLANHTVLIAKDGGERPIADSGAPIRSANGAITGVVLVFRDQTEERAAQRALEESERKFRDAVRYLDEGYYVCAVDGLLQDHNVAFNRILGFNSDDDLKGSKLPDFWQNPEDRTGYLSELRSKGIVRSFLINAKTISGHKLVVMANSHLVNDENGNPVRIEGTFTDFTERRRMEEALREHRDHLEILVEQRTRELAESEQRLAKETAAVAEIVGEMLSGDLADAETDRQVLDACLDATGSAYGMIGAINQHGRYDVTAYNGRTLGDCAFPEALAWEMTTGLDIRGIWGWPMIHGKPLPCNNLPDHPDRVGQPRGHVPIECFLGVPVKRDGKVTGMVAVANKPGGYAEADERTLTRLVDVLVVSRRHRELLTELEQRVRDRTAQLEESNKELEAFSYSVSHDLRAPLRAIDGFTRILEDDYASHLNTEGKRLCSVIHENAGRMSRLIDDLLTFSRLGRTEMSLSRIDMATMASSVFYELTTPESRARIDFQVGTVPPAVADPTLMRQVWTNLLSNAIKFSSKRERAVIKVSARQGEGEMVYTVQDDGAGFDMQYVGKLFGVFQRLHSSREFEGTGVGLALVQRVIRRHGGRVWGEGEPDRGATFYFALQQEGT